MNDTGNIIYRRRWSVLLAILAVLGTAAGCTSSTERSQSGTTPLATTPTANAHAVQGSVWVANEEGNSVTLIDAATQQVVTTLSGIPGPHNVQAAPDGQTVWVVSGHESLAVAIDTNNYTIRGTVTTGKLPAHVILTPDGRSAYVSNSEDNTVSAIDVAKMKVRATIAVGTYPHGLRPSPDGKWVYVANMQSNNVSVIDSSSDTVAATIAVGQKPVQVGFAPDGKAAFVSLNAENAVGKIDVATQQLTGKAQVGRGPVQVYVSPDGKYLLVANQGTKDNPSNSVSVIDPTTLAVIQTVTTAAGAHGVAIDTGSKQGYITNTFADELAIVDLATQQVVTHIAVGKAPNGVSYSPHSPAAAASSDIKLPLPDSDAPMSPMPAMP